MIITPVVSLLDLRFDPDRVTESLAVLEPDLEVSRAFDGCLSADVMVDAADAGHVVVVERWESLAHDDAYRAWRATPDGATGLAAVVIAPPGLTRLTAAG